MPGIKSIAKNALGAVGLLRPAQSAWYWHLRRVGRRDTSKLYRQFISPEDLCFDIGANIGEHSQVMLELGARVVAVEPQSENVEALRVRFSGNANFVLVPKALASHAGSGELMVCGFSECSSMSAEFVATATSSGRLPSDIYQWNEVREIATATLDELIRDHGLPAFAKIDVEGFEAEVLKGCSHRLRALSLEFTPERLQPALDCVEMLEGLGDVEFNYTVEFSKKFELPQWVSGPELADCLKTRRFPVVIAPGGDLYARFK